VRIIAGCFIIVFCLAPVRARADMFGGDIAYLAQILQNAIRQLAELRNIAQTQEDYLDLVREINRGINDSLEMVRSTFPNLDPGIYRDWRSVSEALNELERIYGVIKDSPERQVQRDTDQNVSEAVVLNNEVYKYTSEIDELGEAIKDYSHRASPGGAQKLTAQTLGVMLQVLNQSLRVHATGLKLQAQTLALKNKKDKAETSQYLEMARELRASMKDKSHSFTVPRF
jgi:hypothetical protein